MKGQSMRFIFRPTIVYIRIPEQSLAAQCLRFGVDVSIQFANLYRAFLDADDKPSAWPILAAEFKALEQLDIPYFGLSTDRQRLSRD
jgi:class II lanthipeptide synthase